MARPIKLTPELQESALEEFKRYLENGRVSDGILEYSQKLGEIEVTEKANVFFTSGAYLKMLTLIQNLTGEVGWHGTVKREGTTFLIEDILVYPQTVTGAAVTTDEVEYGQWLQMTLTDEQINTCRFHGHSHVNFAASPSGVDTLWYEQILQTLNQDDYYIFLIQNKKGDTFIEIYDLANNIIYENKDIYIEVLADNDLLNEWYTKQKEVIKEPIIEKSIYSKKSRAKDNAKIVKDFYSDWEVKYK